MKKIFTLAMLTIALTGARASVVINETNFPDENLRFVASQYDADENGTLSDDRVPSTSRTWTSSACTTGLTRIPPSRPST